ncbi:DUF4835 family protein [Flavobacterium filum]|uniref:type IX secretion system protein PorD n=1 Tax=Flavobacterium filum TaxID=370974 RepID=UPI000401728E|nr:DUF4835 family protein [Flavobacterium filum]
MNKVFTFLFLALLLEGKAQELSAVVTINSDKVTTVNPQVFKTLQTSLNDFINKTKWTTQTIEQNERIECSFFINISEVNNTNFAATLQVQASRPVFNSIYSTPILNINDKDFSFRYLEFESLNYNPNSFDSNLIAMIAFYSYMILAYDADSFEFRGGDQYLDMAQNVVNLAQGSGYKGWAQADGLLNRYFLANDMISSTFDPVRQAFFEYHTNGLDKMANDVKKGKENVKEALSTLFKIHRVRPNAYLTRVFFDAKSDEILSIFSGGPNVDLVDLTDNLNRVSPTNSIKWNQIKN